jgi:hypothetical protein
MSAKVSKGAGVALLLALTSCATVPPLSEDGIAVSEIVQRVKCEIWAAMPSPSGIYPTGAYQWMRDWTAKVDLTLMTNDTAGITPSTTFITPLATQVVPGVGSVMRSFTLGVGGGLNTTAVREETLSFTLSVAQLRNPKYLGNCELPFELGLLGNLGLKEWIASALDPVDRKKLTVGDHKAPGSKPAPATGAKATGHEDDPVLQKVAEMNAAAAEAAAQARNAETSATNATRYAKQVVKDNLDATPDDTQRDIQAAYDAAAATYGQSEEVANQVSLETKAAQALAKMLPGLISSDPDKKDPKIQNEISEINKWTPIANKIAVDATTSASASKTKAAAAISLMPNDPPIDSIGHQIQFVVALSGNITPNWTLVHFKGPAPTSTLASASRSITHTINIALGSPAPPTGAKQVGDDQLRQLYILHQDAAFRTSVSP